MIKIYIIFGLVLGILGCYWAGYGAGRSACKIDYAAKEKAGAGVIQNKLITIKGKIDEETYHAGTADIRGRLRDKYTIKD